MAPLAIKRQRDEAEPRQPKKKLKVKRQAQYHSSSEDEEQEESKAQAPPRVAAEGKLKPKSILKQSVPELQESGMQSDLVNEDEMTELEKNIILNTAHAEDSDENEEDSIEEGEEQHDTSGSEEEEDEPSDPESETISITSSNTSQARKKRNDPSAFATSISKILDTKLTTAKRQDPVLSRSKSAADANQTLSEEKLEHKARAQIRAEKKAALERGRVKDVLGLETDEVETGEVLEEEKRLKKTAQRGVVKLFNAVRAAQVKAEEGMKQAQKEGVVGMQKREERVNEMSKQGFLDLISSGGKKSVAA